MAQVQWSSPEFRSIMGCCSGRCTLAFICGMQLVSLFLTLSNLPDIPQGCNEPTQLTLTEFTPLISESINEHQPGFKSTHKHSLLIQHNTLMDMFSESRPVLGTVYGPFGIKIDSCFSALGWWYYRGHLNLLYLLQQ